MAEVKKAIVNVNGSLEEATEGQIIESAVGMPNTTIGDKVTDVGTSWTQLTGTSHNLLIPVTIKADPANSGFIQIGVKNDPPNEAGDPTMIVAKMDSGMALMFPEVDDPSKIFYLGSVALDDMYWSAGKQV